VRPLRTGGSRDEKREGSSSTAAGGSCGFGQSLDARGRPRLALAPAQIPVVIIGTSLPVAAQDRKSLFIPYVRLVSLSPSVDACRKLGGKGV